MQYINPYILLKLTPQDLESSPKLLRSAKKLLLADIELDGNFRVEGIRVERSEALRIIDELDDENKREFHSEVFHNKLLNKFLTDGNTELFFDESSPNFASDADFLHFLLPYYAEKFNQTFFEAVKKGNLEEIRQMQKSPIILEGKYFDISREKVRRYFNQKLHDLEYLLDCFNREPSIDILLPVNVSFSKTYLSFFNPFQKSSKITPLREFEESIFKAKDRRVLNILSDEFQNLRDEIAKCIQNIGVAIVNELGEEEISLSLLKIADGFDLNRNIRHRIEENLEFVIKEITNRNIIETIDLVKKILYQSEKGIIIKSAQINSLLDLVVDEKALSQASSNENNNSIIAIVFEISKIAIVVSKNYYDLDTSLQILDKALKIRLNPETVDRALRQKLATIREGVVAQNKSKNKSNHFKSFQEKSSKTSDNEELRFLTQKSEPSVFASLFISNLRVFLWSGIILAIISGAIAYKLSENPKHDPRQPTVPQSPAGMVLVTGGEFMMGRNESKLVVDLPSHKVSIESFFMDKYETTNEEYLEFIKATKHPPPPQWENGKFPSGQNKYPVVGVNWEDANAYAKWKGKRLPSEDEWEFAAKGPKNYKYPWGDIWTSDKANANGESKGFAEVGKFNGASPFGIIDMVGNAWEWTSSDFKPYPNGTIPTTYKGKSNLKTIRGGSFTSDGDYATTTYRIGWEATKASDYSATGFRCVMDIPSGK